MAAQQSLPHALGRVAEITALLGAVSDPELDEPVTELGFVTSVAVSEEGGVEIGFRLPTYWCAANFAYLMADDMRAAAGALPWVRSVRVVLDEHMYAETVNRGMQEGLSFQQAFGAEADGDLAELRRVFMLKAFQRRQLALIEHLLGAGHAASALLALDIAALRRLESSARRASDCAPAISRNGRSSGRPKGRIRPLSGPTARPSRRLRCRRICAPAGGSPSTPSSTARSAAAFWWSATARNPAAAPA